MPIGYIQSWENLAFSPTPFPFFLTSGTVGEPAGDQRGGDGAETAAEITTAPEANMLAPMPSDRER